MQTRVVWGALAAVLLALFVFIFQTYTQDLDVRRGDELFAQQRFQDALAYYLRAERRAQGGLRARLLYRIGATYERLEQCDRANDFFVKLLKEYPGGQWEQKAKDGFLHCLIKVDAPPGVDDAGPEALPLIRARMTLRRSYRRLVSMLRENRSGIPVQLEENYRKYKADYEEYVTQIKAGLKALDRGEEP